jgi:hypothetical protein
MMMTVCLEQQVTKESQQKDLTDAVVDNLMPLPGIKAEIIKLHTKVTIKITVTSYVTSRRFVIRLNGVTPWQTM